MKITFIPILFLVVWFTIYSQNSSEESTSILWEVSSESVNLKSYLFGTHHFFKGNFVDTSLIINKIIDYVGTFIVEISDYTIDTSFMIESMKMKENDYYAFPAVGDEDLLRSYIKDKTGNETIATFYFNLKPMALWLILFYGKYFDIETKTGDKEVMLDEYFRKTGNKLNKEVIGLETVNELLSLFFDSIPIKKQTEILMDLVKKGNYYDENMSILDNCYKDLDLNCISKFTIFPQNYTEENRLFIEGRNIKWMSVIPEIINKKATLIAVGAGHLPGEHGLINLLKKLGYKVIPIKF
jgi:uncharacterized protein YbaP (TraB family)